jgi:Acetyltransferase (GNAT) domain
MTDKEKYIQLCETDSSISIFGQAWWLDAVCQDWAVSIVLDNNGNIIGAMPYTYKKRKLNITTIEMPPLTSYLPVWIKRKESEKLVSIYSHEHTILSALIKNLPRVAFFNQYYAPSLQNAMPFQWAGFEDSTIYSYILDLTDRAIVMENFKRETRNHIRKAEKVLVVDSINDASLFYDILLKTYKRHGLTISYTKEFFVELDNVLNLKHQRKIYFARNIEDEASGNKCYHSAFYVVWDNAKMYSIASGGEIEQMRLSSARSLFFWHAIQDAFDMQLEQFDFCNVSLPQIEQFKRSFGGVRQSYFKMSKFISPFFSGVYKVLKNR